MKKARKKEAGELIDEPTVRLSLALLHEILNRSQEDPTFPLVDVPDEEVSAKVEYIPRTRSVIS